LVSIGVVSNIDALGFVACVVCGCSLCFIQLTLSLINFVSMEEINVAPVILKESEKQKRQIVIQVFQQLLILFCFSQSLF